MNPKALHKISYGMYVVSSKAEDKINGQMANTVFQITADPPRIAVAVHHENYTNECIDGWRSFSVSVLSKDTPLSFIGSFGFRSGRDYHKFQGIEHRMGKTGVPVVTENAVAYVEAQVIDTLKVGTHILYIGEVVDTDTLKEGEVMTYEYYHSVKGGTLSKKASHYIKEKEEPKEVSK